MASEQTRGRKKKSRNLSQEQHCPQILYRHQDCIPNPKLLHNCEQHRLCGFKNVQEGDHLNKLTSTEEIIDNRTKQVNINPKNAKKLEKGSKEADINNQSPNNSTERNNEELSKSRKRRLRKRRLLTSLAPSLKPNNLSLPSENTSPTKPLSNTCPASSALPVPTSNNNDSDLSKTSPKNSRKRFEKSVGFRNKSIKSKSLVDCTNQSKSDIIKSIEEKTLNSLLQTLAPLTNSSPKKEKVTTTPLFSFPEKRLSCGDSKVDKDGVFYFGETKHQLEKLTSGLNKSSTVAQNNKLKENGFSINNLNSIENCSPLNTSTLSNGSINSLTAITQNSNNTYLLPLTSTENKRLFSFGSTDLQSKEVVFKSEGQVDQNQLLKELAVLNKPYVQTSLTNVLEDKLINETNTDTIEHSKSPIEKSQHSSIKSSVHKADITPSQEETKKNLSTMKSTDETVKTNKSREEILLEREAKKAAKLAAKMKNKINPTKKEVATNESIKGDSSETVTPISKESNIKNTKAGSENSPSSIVKDPQNKPSNGHKQGTSEDQSKVSSSQDPGKNEHAKSKAELKAERRTKQEAQRAAKALAKTVQPLKETVQEKATQKIRKEFPKNDSKAGQTEKKTEITKTTTQPKPKLFSHLYQEKTSNQILKLGGLHPAIVRLGIQYSTRVVVGSNARCIALLHALKQMIKAYSTPPEKEFSRGLEEELGPVTQYLHQCRPLAVSMTNALKHIKRSLVQLPNTISDSEARRKICDLVDTYIHEQIDTAGKAICQTVELKIANGDVILTYGCSSLVCKILVESHQNGKKFRVVVVDGLPWLEGREMLRRLVDKGLSCTYVLISAASFIMREASKVLLGAHALLANGCVMSRAGSSQVALLAHCYNVPVLVCCETHKFSERVQTDAFVYNELGELCCDKIKDKNRVIANLTPISLAYDITPPDLVTAVVTERAILPCTSVPVILRIKPSESVL